jgi:hypothetical protein
LLKVLAALALAPVALLVEWVADPVVLADLAVPVGLPAEPKWRRSFLLALS